VPKEKLTYKTLFHTKNIQSYWYFCLKNNENFTYKEDTITLHREIIESYVKERPHIYCKDFSIILDFNKRNSFQQYWGYYSDPTTVPYRIVNKKDGRHYIIIDNIEKYQIQAVYGDKINGYYKIILVKIKDNSTP